MTYKAAEHAPPPNKLHQGKKQTETKRMKKPMPYKKGVKGKTDS